MIVSTFDLRRGLLLVAAMVLFAGGLAIAPAGAVPGVPPSIVQVLDNDADVDPGEARAFVVEIEGMDSGATLEFSGTGLTVTTYRVTGFPQAMASKAA